MEVIKAGDVTIKSNLEEVKNAAAIDILAWLEAIGEDAAETAAEKAPVDTGRLKNSISWATPVNYGGGSSVPQATPEKNSVYIGTNVRNEEGKNYAIYHEFGTGKYAVGGRQTPWAFKDKNGQWHYTHGVPAKHFLKFGVTAHKSSYKKALEMFLKGQE